MTERHIPVLIDEVIAALAPQPGERMIDGTFGAGGYTRAILAPGGLSVLGIDRDPAAIAAGRALGLAGLTLAHGVYSDMAALADEAGFAPADGICCTSCMHGGSPASVQ